MNQEEALRILRANASTIRQRFGVRHAYFGLDDATLWDIIRNKIPPLLDSTRRIMEETS